MVEECGVKVIWRAFPLHPETPDEGLLLEELFHCSRERIVQMVAEMKQVARSLGLEIGDRIKTYNTRLAQELGLWAEDMGFGDSFHRQAFLAYFVHGRNLAEVPVLLDLVQEAGLDREKAGDVLLARSYKERVDQDWALAKEKAITAVPTFVLGSRRLVGAQSYEALKEFLVSPLVM